MARSLQTFCSAWKKLVSPKAVESSHFVVIHIMPRWSSLDFSRINLPNHVKLIAGTTWAGKSVSFPVWPIDLCIFFQRVVALLHVKLIIFPYIQNSLTPQQHIIVTPEHQHNLFQRNLTFIVQIKYMHQILTTIMIQSMLFYNQVPTLKGHAIIHFGFDIHQTRTRQFFYAKKIKQLDGNLSHL